MKIENGQMVCEQCGKGIDIVPGGLCATMKKASLELGWDYVWELWGLNHATAHYFCNQCKHDFPHNEKHLPIGNFKWVR